MPLLDAAVDEALKAYMAKRREEIGEGGRGGSECVGCGSTGADLQNILGVSEKRKFLYCPHFPFLLQTPKWVLV